MSKETKKKDVVELSEERLKKTKDRREKNRKEAEKEAIEELKKQEEYYKPHEELVKGVNDKLADDYYLARKKKHNASIAFAQMFQHNLQILSENKYLTQAEESFLFKIAGYLDFGTNVIVKKEFKNQKKVKSKDPFEDINDVSDAATTVYIAGLLDMSRGHTSRLLNGLKEKGILATAETGMRTEDGRVCTSRTWFMNPNIMFCGDKSDVDKVLKYIFRDALKNIKDQNGKKVTLPINILL